MPAPKNQLELSKNRARELLDLNNSASSGTSDSILSVLEAGEGSFVTRNILDQFLHNYLNNIIPINRAKKTLGYERTKLRQHLSVKDKLAYITANLYAHNTRMNISTKTPRTSINNIDDIVLRTQLEELIRNIEENLLNNRDFTESRILRNAAINRFVLEPKITVSERNELNGLANNLKTFCNDNGVTDLAYATDFTNESDAQKIMKIYEVLGQLSAIGLNPPENTVKGFEKFDEKIKPLKDLDEHFKHMTKTLNMIHRVAQKSYHSMVTPNQREKVQKILNTIGETENVNKTLSEFNQIEKFKTNNEHTFIEDILKKVQDNPKYEETLLANGISKAQFNEWFISLNAFILTEGAKRGFESQKEKTFGTRTKDFEADTQSRRGMVRRRLFEIADRMVGNNFAPGPDADIANSYFDKFKDLFFAKEEDNYREAPDATHENHYNRMARVTAAIIRNRVPALDSRHRIGPGSVGRRMLKFVEHALKGTNRGLFNRIRQQRHNADDATVVAMIVMAQNQATNQMFYQDKNQFNEREGRRYSKIFRRIRFAEDGRKAVRDVIAPTANKALQLTEIATKKGLQLASGTAKVANTVASKSVRGLTRATGGLTGKFNGMIEKNGYKRWKTPFYLPYLLTKPIQQGSELLNKGATWTDKNLNGEIKKIDAKVGQGYDEAKKVVGEATGEETKYLFQGLTYATEQATSLLGKTISAGGKAMHDAYTTGQQRSILGAFYAAASEQKGLEDLMQSSELADILNLKERGPYLFDEDGRFLMTDKEKTEKNAESIGKEISKNIKKQGDLLIKQAEDIIKEKKKKEKVINESSEEESKKQARLSKISKEINSANGQKTIIKDIHSEIINLTPILEKPVDGSGKLENLKIIAGVSKLQRKLKNTGTGYINKIEKNLGNGTTPGFKKDLKDAETEKKNKEKDIYKLQDELEEQQGLSESEDNKIRADALNEIKGKKGEIRAKKEELEKQNTIIEENRIEIASNEEFLSWLQKIYNEFENLKTLNTEIGNAIPTKEQLEKLSNFNKNLDILLYPEEKTDGKIINLNSLTEDKRKEIEKLLAS